MVIFMFRNFYAPLTLAIWLIIGICYFLKAKENFLFCPALHSSSLSFKCIECLTPWLCITLHTLSFSLKTADYEYTSRMSRSAVSLPFHRWKNQGLGLGIEPVDWSGTGFSGSSLCHLESLQGTAKIISRF